MNMNWVGFSPEFRQGCLLGSYQIRDYKSLIEDQASAIPRSRVRACVERRSSEGPLYASSTFRQTRTRILSSSKHDATDSCGILCWSRVLPLGRVI